MGEEKGAVSGRLEALVELLKCEVEEGLAHEATGAVQHRGCHLDLCASLAHALDLLKGVMHALLRCDVRADADGFAARLLNLLD